MASLSISQRRTIDWAGLGLANVYSLPAMSDVLKKKKMLEYLLETRRQMIKLLVLVKWAKVSKEVNQCIVRVSLEICLTIGCRTFPSRAEELLQ